MHVIAAERTLIPRTAIGYGVRAHGTDVSLEDVQAWLRERGWQILGRVDA